MKKTIKNSMLVVILSVMTLAMARANDFYLSVKKDDNRTVDLFIEKTNQPLAISFVDARGEVLYNYKYKELPTNVKRYNFKNLPTGTYYFVVESETKIEKVPVVLSENETVVKRGKTTTIYKPYFRKDNNLLSVNMLSIDESPVDVKIYNETTNQLIHEEVLKGEKSLGKRFDFSNVNGVYRFEVTHKGNTFYKTVSL
ncbi:MULTISPECIES: DUF3244 domain-containing protein [Galbibacter]|uniref:DUF3244 domain-containing protein n=1 Tax=Galbibacter pacificus TaxID=2996052 RepID=A0ABT6FW44_9FLAO|nr:DUF3244 domain-containing protein [Galbibacter pacificus]MDG3583781.1 DUF3244 domain-containing protein [Galbibacter pacificus]MDG3587301.1 DUF3244 domain-containing protein [Galbibacter pacificus]